LDATSRRVIGRATCNPWRTGPRHARSGKATPGCSAPGRQSEGVTDTQHQAASSWRAWSGDRPTGPRANYPPARRITDEGNRKDDPRPVFFRPFLGQIETFCRSWFGPRSRGSVKAVLVARSNRSPKDLARTQPGPSGFRAAGAHFVGPLGRTTGTTFAPLRVDRLTARETERFNLTQKRSSRAR